MVSLAMGVIQMGAQHSTGELGASASKEPRRQVGVRAQRKGGVMSGVRGVGWVMGLGLLLLGLSGASPTALDEHARALSTRAPKGFTVVVQSPFVVIGDEAPEQVQRRARGTVKWAVDRLKESYFEKDPSEVYDIWLFKDSESYYTHAEKFWGSRPDTPYGYASSTDRVLVMNIGTGGGTLVHEIVHPFMAANFPNCPSWFNEGLASLYEQSAERKGRIVGLTNWRLAGLQQSIRAGQLPSFKTLTHTSSSEFYGEGSGSHYAQARYLMYYLQERGLLRKYYRSFVTQQASDPTGYQTLQQTLGRTDMVAFQREWEAWVLALSFP